LKLPSPFTFTVRAATDCVKAFRKHLPESGCLAGLVRGSTVRELRTPESIGGVPGNRHPYRDPRSIPDISRFGQESRRPRGIRGTNSIVDAALV